MLLKKSVVFSLFLLVLTTKPIQAQETAQIPENYNAETMLKICKGEADENDQDMQSMVCTFRIQGIIMMSVENCMSIKDGFPPTPLLTSSAPPSRGAARQAFINFMEDNSQSEPNLQGMERQKHRP
jgi:hypothetical protein